MDFVSLSDDLNDAFYAAGKVGLFDTDADSQEVHLAKNAKGDWEVLVGATGYQGQFGSDVICGEMGYLTRESTPALAICAAILKLKESK